MVVHIKNINAEPSRIEGFLARFKYQCLRIKDTWTIQGVTEEDYPKFEELEKELKAEGKTVFIKKNGL